MKKVCMLLIATIIIKYGSSQIIGIKDAHNRLFISKEKTKKPMAHFIPSNFATCNYGFFCKQELKLEKQTRIPIKFRLANMEYSNWLEGKSRFKPN